ncbi:COMM domain-containing protein 3 [Phlebotomus papatasi]|uniref:COMM domain-containing protein 3 n=1 Tax=Phlebotomus papatasi TaxID=29031 RepID=UPI0024841253|nr:COMM domain-containing protein 3 [Phlebotomus papatasi]
MTNSTDSLNLSEGILKGLQCLNQLQDNETVQKLIENTIRKAIGDASGFKSQLVPGDTINQAEYALVSLVVLSAKHNLSSNELKYLLSLQKLGDSVSDKICREYEVSLPELKAKLSTYGHTEPFITDVNWKMSCNIQSSSVNSNAELMYNISMEGMDYTSGGSRSITNFTCNTEELQSLIAKLKDIEKHCEKIGNEK